MARQSSPEFRLFNLVLALVSSREGLSKEDILSTVVGYRERFGSGDGVALDRQFERDKDDLRDLGLPLEVVDAPGEPGDNHSLRYRIARDEYFLPTGLSFTPEELTLLNLAAVVWREGSLSDAASRAILKLKSLGIPSVEPIVGFAPRVRVREAAFTPLSAASADRKVVSFLYLKAGEAKAQRRTVSPIKLIQYDNRWLLHGWDHDREATRNFLLSRIVGQVTVTAEDFEPFPENSAALALAHLDELWASLSAIVSTLPESDAHAQLVRRRGTVELADGNLEVHYSDRELFADELAAFGPEVFVREPVELVEAVRLRLSEVVRSHG